MRGVKYIVVDEDVVAEEGKLETKRDRRQEFNDDGVSVHCETCS